MSVFHELRPLAFLLRVAAVAALVGACSAVETPGDDASRYLSEDYFPGMALLEPISFSTDGAWSLRYYRGSRRPEGAITSVEAAGWRKLDDAVVALESALRLPPLEQFQSPRALFDAQGRPLEALEDLRRAPVAFFLEIGVWIWPPVRVGFEQEVQGVNGKRATLRTLSLRPKIFEVRDFLSPTETEDVMRIGEKQGLTASKGNLQSADLKKGVAHSKFRTSTQAWLDNELSPLIADLDTRVSELTRVPASHNEAVQLLRYETGQYYHGHMDWGELELYPDQRGAWLRNHFGHQGRLATVFWYLNDVAVGGETIFPKHNQPICEPDSMGGPHTRHCPGAHDPDMSSCEHGLRVRPRAGTVVMWYNYHASGRGDRNALHSGCPVGANLTKWSANKWVSIKPRTSRATWVDDHPAIARFGWTGEGAKPDPNACSISFENHFAEEASVMWVNPSSGAAKALSRVAPGKDARLRSFRDASFYLQVGERATDARVVCRPPETRAVLTKGFVLRDAAQGSDEL